MNALAKMPVWLTVDEFLAWEPGDGRRWQLVNGEPQAMAPGEPTHAFLQAELAALIRSHLLQQGSPCRVAVEPGIVPLALSSRNLRVPDTAVTCTPGDGDEDATLSEPVLVVEILSPSNRSDCGNVLTYPTIPTVQEVPVVHSTRICADLLRRGPGGVWPANPSAVESGNLVLDSIGFQTPLADIYRTTRLHRTS